MCKPIPDKGKAGEGRAAASFKRFIAEHTPKSAIRFSELGYETNPQYQHSDKNIPIDIAVHMDDIP